MKQIALTNSSELVLVNDEDYEKVKNFTWSLINSGYVRAFTGYGKASLMHRYLMGLKKNDVRVIDHINKNKLDNRKENLRVCSQSENLHANRKRKNSSASIYKNVFFNKITKSWYVLVQSNGSRKYGGSFALELEAAQAANHLMVTLHGNNAVLNVC